MLAGGEEGIEDALPRRLAHVAAIISDRDHNVPAQAVELVELLAPNPRAVLHACLALAVPGSRVEAVLAAVGVGNRLGPVSLQPDELLIGFDIRSQSADCVWQKRRFPFNSAGARFASAKNIPRRHSLPRCTLTLLWEAQSQGY